MQHKKEIGLARSGQTQTKRRSSSSNTSRNSGKRRLNSSASEQGFLDNEAKRNIVGISVIILAIILLVAAILPSKAVVTSFVSNVLHLTFGVGCLCFPRIPCRYRVEPYDPIGA